MFQEKVVHFVNCQIECSLAFLDALSNENICRTQHPPLSQRNINFAKRT